MTQQSDTPTAILDHVAVGLDRIARMLAHYLGKVPVWTDSSLCAEDYHSGSVLDLVRTGGINLEAQAIQQLSQAYGHILALSRTIGEPDAILALLTLTRSVLASAGLVHHALATGLHERERARRMMNTYLYWTGEALNYVGDSDAEATLHKRRAVIVASARQSGFTVTAKAKNPLTRVWPEWHVGARLPGEMARLTEMVHAEPAENAVLAASTLYRLMSAAAHAQPHAGYGVVKVRRPPQAADRDFYTPGSLDVREVVRWMYTMGALLNRAVVRAGDYFGWDLQPWEEAMHADLRNWSAIANAKVMEDPPPGPKA